jgi:hypothetical protein
MRTEERGGSALSTRTKIPLVFRGLPVFRLGSDTLFYITYPASAGEQLSLHDLFKSKSSKDTIVSNSSWHDSNVQSQYLSKNDPIVGKKKGLTEMAQSKDHYLTSEEPISEVAKQ